MVILQRSLILKLQGRSSNFLPLLLQTLLAFLEKPMLLSLPKVSALVFMMEPLEFLRLFVSMTPIIVCFSFPFLAFILTFFFSQPPKSLRERLESHHPLISMVTKQEFPSL